MLYVPVLNAQNGRMAAMARTRGDVVPGCGWSSLEFFGAERFSTITGKDHDQRPEETP